MNLLFFAVVISISLVSLFVFNLFEKLNKIRWQFWFKFFLLSVFLDGLTTYLCFRKDGFSAEKEGSPLAKYLLGEFGPLSLVLFAIITIGILLILSFFADRGDPKKPVFSSLSFVFGLLKILASLNNAAYVLFF